MEPFGLLNFLRFALQKNEEKKEENGADFSGEPSANAPEKITPPPAPSQNADAYLSFIERHNTASKRIKKGK